MGKSPALLSIATNNPKSNTLALHVNAQMAIASGSVWAMKAFGTYCCQSNALFGRQPGKLMTQSDALAAGYQPSDTSWPYDSPNQPSGERSASQPIRSSR